MAPVEVEQRPVLGARPGEVGHRDLVRDQRRFEVDPLAHSGRPVAQTAHVAGQHLGRDHRERQPQVVEPIGTQRSSNQPA